MNVNNTALHRSRLGSPKKIGPDMSALHPPANWRLLPATANKPHGPQDSISTAFEPFLSTTEWASETDALRKWTLPPSGSPKIDICRYDREGTKSWILEDPSGAPAVVEEESITVMVGGGSGQVITPFSIERAAMVAAVKELGLSERILSRLTRKSSMFDHTFVTNDTKDGEDPPTVLELVVSTYEIYSFHCFCRYDLATKKAKILLFIKEDHTFTQAAVLDWLEQSHHTLRRHPLLVIDTIISGIQRLLHSFAELQVAVYDMEGRVGVTSEKDTLEAHGFQREAESLTYLNEYLTTLKKQVAGRELSANTLQEHARALLRIAELCGTFELVRQNKDPQGFNLPSLEASEEIHCTITRADLYLRHMQFVKFMLETYTNALYHRINQHDNSLNLEVSQSMKTIAVVTLFYLPSTLVASMLSTSFFDFQAYTGGAAVPISQEWWILPVACMILTVFTLILWILWFKWGKVWITGLNSSLKTTLNVLKVRPSTTGDAAKESTEIEAQPVLANTPIMRPSPIPRYAMGKRGNTRDVRVYEEYRKSSAWLF